MLSDLFMPVVWTLRAFVGEPDRAGLHDCSRENKSVAVDFFTRALMRSDSLASLHSFGQGQVFTTEVTGHRCTVITWFMCPTAPPMPSWDTRPGGE